MDYIDYELNKYNAELEKADFMAELGFETEEEYIDYIESKKYDYQESMQDALLQE